MSGQKNAIAIKAAFEASLRLFEKIFKYDGPFPEGMSESFIEQYEKADGRLYKEYLEKFNVESCLKHRVNFDNFHAFRLK